MERRNTQLATLNNGPWSPSIKPAVARAAYAEVALAAGTWSPSKIERLVSKLSPRPAHLDERSNKFRNILRNNAIPTPATAAEVKRALPTSNLQRWLDHPLFFLLDDRAMDPVFCRVACWYAFDSLPGPIRFHLWHRDVDDAAWSGSVLRALDERAALGVMASDEADALPDLDRLVLATAMGRLAALDIQPNAHEQAQWIAYACSGETIARTPQLLVSWPWLLPALQAFWLPSNRGGALKTAPGDGRRGLASAVEIMRETNEPLPPDDMFDLTALLAYGA